MIIFILEKDKNLYYSLEYQEKSYIFTMDFSLVMISQSEIEDLKDGYSIKDYVMNDFCLEDKLINEILKNQMQYDKR